MQQRRFTLAGLRPVREPQAKPESHLLQEVAQVLKAILMASPEKAKATTLRGLLVVLKECQEPN
jgi:hypothetical protein